MITNHRVTLAMIGMFMLVVLGHLPGQASAQVDVDVGGVHVHIGDAQPPPPPEGVEVLTRGPVHEAFAQPVIFDDGAGFMITHRPPAAIDEIPPDHRPQGNRIVWIPGYWSRDTDRSDFIWVSGCWRAVPPNTSWVPGYWARSARGYRWIAGFWTTADADEIEYLPAPPASLEEGPQVAGSPDRIWIPGCWVRHEGRYAWRPGFWDRARADWVWVPAQYVYTPRGWVYVEGYWDYPLDRRGVAFLPVYWPSSAYERRDFRYSPEFALDLDSLTLYLFILPDRHQYYFGDYYGPEYAREGYHPWYEVRDHHDWYDPIFVQQQWQHRDDRQWVEHQRTEYQHRRDDKSLRPARTYEAMQAQAARMPEKDRKQAQLGRPMREVVAGKTTPFKFDAVDAKTREATAVRAKEVHAYTDKRAQWESPAAAVPGPGPEPKPVVTGKEPAPMPPNDLPREPQKVKIPRPPIAVREAVRDKDLTPPPRPEQPKPDPNARPKPSKSDTSDRSKDNSPGRSKDRDSSDKDKPDSTKK